MISVKNFQKNYGNLQGFDEFSIPLKIDENVSIDCSFVNPFSDNFL